MIVYSPVEQRIDLLFVRLLFYFVVVVDEFGSSHDVLLHSAGHTTSERGNVSA